MSSIGPQFLADGDATADVLTITLSATTYTLTAGAGTTLVNASAECTGSPTVLTCQPGVMFPAPHVMVVDLADGVDTYTQGAGAGVFGGAVNLGGGDDIYLTPSSAAAGLPVIGGPGNDHVDASGRATAVTATIGPTGVMDGNTGLGAFERITTGSAADTISSRNASSENVTCGGGTDTVTADALDVIAGDCESVDRNRAPVLGPVGNKGVAVGASLAFTVSATDPDANNTLTYTASNLPPGATFDTVTRAFSWTPTAAQSGSSFPGVRFQVSDGTNVDFEDVTIAVTDTVAPETTIDSGAKKVKKPKATFEFSSSEPGSKFECRLDTKPFASCTSPTKVKKLKNGKHLFAVRATDAAGNLDPTPAELVFKVKLPKKK